MKILCVWCWLEYIFTLLQETIIYALLFSRKKSCQKKQFFCPLFLSFFFFKTDCWKPSFKKITENINTCPNHSVFTKWAFKEVQNLQRTQAGWDRASIVTRSYLRQLWGRQACEGGGQPPQNLTAVVSPVPEPTANKHRAVVCSSLPSLQGAALLGLDQRNASLILFILPSSLSQLPLTPLLAQRPGALWRSTTLLSHHCP